MTTNDRQKTVPGTKNDKTIKRTETICYIDMHIGLILLTLCKPHDMSITYIYDC